MADPKLDVLNERLETLEKRVFGDADKDADYPKDTSEILDTLCSINTQINSSTAGRPQIESVFKQLGELDKYLDTDAVDQLTVSLSAKMDMILAEEDVIREHAAALEQIEQMCDVLGSEHLKAVPALQSQLYDLSKVHIQQQDEMARLSEETKTLFDQYNNIITLLSKQFVQWDSILTDLELKKQPQATTE